MLPRPHRAEVVASAACSVLLAATLIGMSAAVVAAQPTDGPMTRLAYLHRHGARSEPFVRHTEVADVLDWDFCLLTQTGLDMAASLGRFLRKEYGNAVTPNGASPTGSFPVLPRSFDRRRMRVISTDFERTVRTAYSLLHSLFPNLDANASSSGTTTTSLDFANTTTVPFIEHQQQLKDLSLDYYYSWPSAMLKSRRFALYPASANGQTLTLLNQTILDDIGSTLGCSSICRMNQTLCALFAEDVSTCRLSNGGIDPFLNGLLPDLKQVQLGSNAFLYMADPATSEYWKNVGPYALLVLQRTLNFFLQMPNISSSGVPTTTATTTTTPATDTPSSPTSENDGPADTYLEYDDSSFSLPEMTTLHWSAHDITIYGIFIALGIIDKNTPTNGSTALLVPTFTATLFFEGYAHNASVTLRYATCEQEHDSGYAFSFVDSPSVLLNCISDASWGAYLSKRRRRNVVGDDSTASPEVYQSINCPIADLQRYLDWRWQPAFQPNPQCYQDPVDVALTGCEASAVPPLSSACNGYRKYCPQYACQGTAADLANFSEWSETAFGSAYLAARVPDGVAATLVNASVAPSSWTYDQRTNLCLPRLDVPAKEVTLARRAAAQSFIGVAAFLLGAVVGLFIATFRSQWKAADAVAADDAEDEKRQGLINGVNA